jgi:glycosyltransferase involved in cell wall biosynthesis
LARTIDSAADDSPHRGTVAVIVAAQDEAERIGQTLAALRGAFPLATLWVADDGSLDGTVAIAHAAGARVVTSARSTGKGGAMTAAARAALGEPSEAGSADGGVFVLCDGDLGSSAALLAPLARAVAERRAELAVAIFARSVGGGFGIALGFAAWAIRRRCGLVVRAPISGQRALSRSTLESVLPFAAGYGMEIGMTIDAAGQGLRVVELELDLSHRATGRTLSGFLHRARQLLDFARAYARGAQVGARAVDRERESA